VSSVREIEVVQNTLYTAYLEAEKLPPEEAMKVVKRILRSGMTQEQVAHCEKLLNEK
jgi:hypothetical protein